LYRPVGTGKAAHLLCLVLRPSGKLLPSAEFLFKLRHLLITDPVPFLQVEGAEPLQMFFQGDPNEGRSTRVFSFRGRIGRFQERFVQYDLNRLHCVIPSTVYSTIHREQSISLVIRLIGLKPRKPPPESATFTLMSHEADL